MSYEHLDTELVNALLDDGRASLRNIAEELDVSVTTVSNHLSDLEDAGAIEGYAPIVDYDALGYDVTAVMQLKVDGNALPKITEKLQQYQQMVSVYEVTGDHDIIAVAKFTDTDQMNAQIKTLLTDPDINESNTSIVLNSVSEAKQFELEIDDSA
ncbi:Lrp/AsnC family transcriptional regulator [Halobacteria archaeon AArc-m2/3/4]|uniref:Lrp/AsnC family transcriptional regulator n=1 Tax=Natronoglomus mannanivorans TaxID=2979990 RepID=A0AAP2Z0U6_9EURY|nr:Lrp/AsnC family transcriptional regulator [Halobacteria archaeon AArc-xg1-1]MCU4973864.1 Lrp/AsnC family transcriptional regulator [Halobacteria archaeon AArc-m2/3/4]